MKIFSILIFCFLSTNVVLAHGENKYGPHKGFIRMPGTFHTELVPNHDDSFNVFLMDVNNKNQTNKDSSVKLTYLDKKQKSEFICLPVEDHFTCSPSAKLNYQKGKLILNAVRLKINSKDAIYELPLKLKEESDMKTDDEMSGHDMSKMK